MGDFSIHDEFTQGLLDTLERLNLYKDQSGVLTIGAIQQASQIALQNFGAPAQMYFPNIARPGLGTLHDFQQKFARVTWDTKDMLPAGFDIKDVKDELSVTGYATFQFMETLRRLDMAPTDRIYPMFNWQTSAEL